MTAADVHRPAPEAAPPPPARTVPGWLRLTWLYLVSRRAPAAVAVLAGLGAVLWASLHWHWDVAGGAAAHQAIPLAIETGAAMVITVTCYGPFGEPERATGRWLPYLRLAGAVLLTAVAFGVLAAGSTAGGLPGGILALLRNVAGMTGIGLLAAAVLGGALGWVAPLVYLVLAEGALADGATTPWAWPARPPHDLGGALCAGAVLAAGLLVTTVRGTRESVRGD
jgi:hypothetical protein